MAKRSAVAASIGVGSDASVMMDYAVGRRRPRQRSGASSRCTLRTTDAKGGNSLSLDDTDENEEFPEFLGGGLAKFYDFRTDFVKFFRKRIAASCIASDNIFKKPDTVWTKVKDIEEAKECEYEEKREAFQGARARSCCFPSFACGRSRNTSPDYFWISREVGRCCVRSPGLLCFDRGHEQAKVGKDESAKQSVQDDKGVTREAQGVARGHRSSRRARQVPGTRHKFRLSEDHLGS